MDITMMTIAQATKEFAEAHAELAECMAELKDEILAAQRRRLPRIKRLVAEKASRQNALTAQLEQSKHLFQKPRTQTIHGVKVGWQKAKGGLEIDDPDRTVTLIEKHYDGAEAAALLHVTKRPNKEALEDLTVAELKKLAVEVTQDGDRVLIKPANSEVDKIVSALLKDALDAAAEAA